MIRIFSLLIFIFIGCTSNKNVNKNEHEYIHIDGRDTSRLRLVVHDNQFFGELKRQKGQGGVVSGVINGNVKGDTLIGDYLYRPYRAREKKRVPIVLLKVGDNYLEGKGQKMEIYGILTYLQHTIKFNDPARTFMLVKE